MPYKTQTSIVIPRETKEYLESIKLPDETWDAFLTNIVQSVIEIMNSSA